MRKAFIFVIALALAIPAAADTFGGVEFPGGSASFADVVVSYTPHINASGQPTAPYRDSSNAVGEPNYDGINPPKYVTLGDGGSIVLRFTDNSLTGNGTIAKDLWIFEVGPDVESTFVDISMDGILWHSVGEIQGSTRGVDLDAFGFGPGVYFSYVRLTDDTNQGGQSGDTVGADIDAVGAISSAPPVNNVPEPSTVVLLAGGFMAFAAKRIHQ